MDEIKDSSKKDDFSKFIDAQEVRTDPFGNNRAAERLYRRVERVCAALYLLTRHVPEHEPLRREIRSSSVTLFDQVLGLRNEMRALESSSLFAFDSSIRRLISLVRLLTAGGFVSFQNADAIIGALDELGTFISSAQRSVLSEGMVFKQEDIVGNMSPLIDRSIVRDIKDKRTLKDTLLLKDNQQVSITPRKIVGPERSEGIVLILRTSEGLGIKDICARLPDYSEKMIQRELALLVKEGRVRKNGLKRWSKYSVV